MSKPSLLEKVIYGLFTRKNSEGTLTPKKGVLIKRILNFYTGKKFERLRKSSTKFNLNNLEDYFDDFMIEHISSNTPFVININKDIVTDLQIVHPSLIKEESMQNRKLFGFTIHLPFNSDELGKSEFELFNQSSLNQLFREEPNTEIRTYYCDIGRDTKQLAEIIRKVLLEVKKYEENDTFIFSHWYV